MALTADQQATADQINDTIDRYQADLANNQAQLDDARIGLSLAQGGGNQAGIAKYTGAIASLQTQIASDQSSIAGAQAQLSSLNNGGAPAVSSADPTAPSADPTNPIPANTVNPSAQPVDDNNTGFYNNAEYDESQTNAAPQPVDANNDGFYNDAEYETDTSTQAGPTDVSDPSMYFTNPASAGTFTAADGSGTSFSSPLSSAIQQGINQAQQQQTMSSQSGQQASSTDWRVRISLAKGANYLYNDPSPGILQPLQTTSGVIFPYTPKIDTVYKANYQTYEATHSNYKGYFYQNSSVDPVTITGHFTAQNSNDANYLLAVIHFFRSVTKMFYGQDAQKGSPPPLVYLSGFGQYQFNGMPCVVTSFNYTLPDDVDYIRAGVANNLGLNATTISNVLNSVVASGAIGGYARLAAAFTTPGALPATPFGSLATPNLASGAPTMVPTKMDITVTLLPVVSRQKVSTQFSVKGYANGNLLRGGFW